MEMIIYLLLLYPLKGLAFDNSVCGQLRYDDGRGVIRSRTGDTAITCNYRILSGPSSWVRLKWTFFDVRGKMPYCQHDYVIVRRGCYGKQPTIAKFCSSNMRALPHTIYAPDCISITYRSSGSSVGFSGEYRSFDLDNYQFPSLDIHSTCYSFGDNIYDSSGVIGSPYWPRTYAKRRMWSSSKCEWEIKSSSGRRISVNIMDMDMAYRVGSSCYNNGDYVKLKGEKSVSSRTSSRYYCKNVPNATLATRYYQIEIQMKINFFSSSTNKRGFLIGFVTYEDEIVRGVSKVGMIAGIAVVVIIVMVCLCCCCKKYKRHRQTNNEQSPLQSEPGVLPPSSTKYTEQPVPAVPYNAPPYPGAPSTYPANPLPYQGATAPSPAMPPFNPSYQGGTAPYPDMPHTNPSPYPGGPYPEKQPADQPPPYQAVPTQYPPQPPPQGYPLYPPPNYSTNPVPPP